MKIRRVSIRYSLRPAMIPYYLVHVLRGARFFLFFSLEHTPLVPLVSPLTWHGRNTRWFDLISIVPSRGSSSRYPSSVSGGTTTWQPMLTGPCRYTRAYSLPCHPSRLSHCRVRNFRIAPAYTRSSVRFDRAPRNASRLFNYFALITSRATGNLPSHVAIHSCFVENCERTYLIKYLWNITHARAYIN